MSHSPVLCPKTGQERPVVCVPIYRWDDEMTAQTVICYDCKREQPDGAAAVRAYYEQIKE